MRSEFHIDAFKLLLIESRFLEVKLTGANASLCCVSIASDVLNQTILDWRLFNCSSLAKATVLALNSILERASDAAPRESRLGHRYRYGNDEYVVTAMRDDCVWLQRSDSRHRDAAKLNSQATPSFQRQALPNRTSIARTGALAKVKEHHPNPLKHSRLNRQPEAIQQLIRDVVNKGYTIPSLSKKHLVRSIVHHISYLNESRPFNEQLKAPSFATLYRLIRELHEDYKNHHQHGSACNEHRRLFPHD